MFASFINMNIKNKQKRKTITLKLKLTARTSGKHMFVDREKLIEKKRYIFD